MSAIQYMLTYRSQPCLVPSYAPLPLRLDSRSENVRRLDTLYSLEPHCTYQVVGEPEARKPALTVVSSENSHLGVSNR